MHKKSKRFSCSASGLMAGIALMFAMAPVASADVIPYPNTGTPNPVPYAFTATATGDVIAFFAGSHAGDEDQLGMLDNGTLTTVSGGGNFCLDDHTSAIGDACNLGMVTAGDTLVFVMKNLAVGGLVYSDPSLNTSYDTNGSAGHNHVYSTEYTATSPVIDGIPPGVYVAFEDEAFPSSDFNYDDETFVVTNVTGVVPEPSVILLLGTAVLGLGTVFRRKLTA
jgi:hypothetical protein